jgi:hypothetical protein
MSARAEQRAAPQQWRDDAAKPSLARGDILRAVYRHEPTLARLLRITVLRAVCREREVANTEPNVRVARFHAEEARRLEAAAEILKELAA